MSAPKFEIKGGWLRVDDGRRLHSIRMDIITGYQRDRNGSTVSIWSGQSKCNGQDFFSAAGLADALDAWFDREGEVERILREMVWVEADELRARSQAKRKEGLES